MSTNFCLDLKLKSNVNTSILKTRFLLNTENHKRGMSNQNTSSFWYQRNCSINLKHDFKKERRHKRSLICGPQFWLRTFKHTRTIKEGLSVFYWEETKLVNYLVSIYSSVPLRAIIYIKYHVNATVVPVASEKCPFFPPHFHPLCSNMWVMGRKLNAVESDPNPSVVDLQLVKTESKKRGN